MPRTWTWRKRTTSAEGALLAAAGEHGYMASILRSDRENYTVEYSALFGGRQQRTPFQE
ncbi:MAG: hypothetical protein R3C12_12465 [Planctomycetaceae bacterium]